MRRIVLLGVVLVLSTLVYVEAQRGGPRGRGGGGGATLERDWALVCFELYITGDQFDSVRSAFLKAYGERKKVMEGARTRGGDAQQTGTEMAQIQKDLEAKYATLFTKQQLELLNQLKSSPRGGGGGRRR